MTKTYYDTTSKGYDELHKYEQLNKLRIIKKHLDVDINDKLLDVGCGSGISSDFDCVVIGIDPSVELLKIAKVKFPDKVFVKGVGEKLPFKDKSFDIVISITAVHNFNNIKKGLQEIKRVGKDRFVLSILKKSNSFDRISKLINQNFNVDKIVEEDKDVIYFLS
tara:strand:- start:4305 stop:4796 length:492 start_codon:yes stop_codon:yes gene_type:complete